MSDKPFPNYKEITKPQYEPTEEQKQSYRQVEEWIVQYQGGDKSISEILINNFEGYLVRYYQILCHGNIDDRDYRSREFIACFIGSPRRRSTLFAPTAIAKTDLDSTSKLLKTQLSSYDTEEIWNTIVMSFLELAMNHEANLDAPCFHNYVVKMYHNVLAKNVQDMAKDPLVYSSSVRFVDNLQIGEDGSEIWITENVPDTHEEIEEINEIDWIFGQQKLGIFQYLSSLERQVIIWRYVDKINLKAIGDYIGVQQFDVQNMIKQIKSKLRALSVLSKEEGDVD